MFDVLNIMNPYVRIYVCVTSMRFMHNAMQQGFIKCIAYGYVWEEYKQRKETELVVYQKGPDGAE